MADHANSVTSHIVDIAQRDQRASRADVEEVVVELYRRMRPSLVNYVHRVIGATNDAEDVVQIAFIKLLDQYDRAPMIVNVRAWLYRVVHNLALDYAEGSSKQRSMVDKWVADHDSNGKRGSPEQDLIARETLQQLYSVLNGREKACLALRAEGLSYREIAEALSISVKSVSVYLVRGLKKVNGSSDGGT